MPTWEEVLFMRRDVGDLARLISPNVRLIEIEQEVPERAQFFMD